ncbi:MAG TPA: hypothetical protein VEY95_08990 [Azospirillaceae bacterium]|nr:hypothetical protein [Azospirillaceae bacterium]
MTESTEQTRLAIRILADAVEAAAPPDHQAARGVVRVLRGCARGDGDVAEAARMFNGLDPAVRTKAADTAAHEAREVRRRMDVGEPLNRIAASPRRGNQGQGLFGVLNRR